MSHEVVCTTPAFSPERERLSLGHGCDGPLVYMGEVLGSSSYDKEQEKTC